MLIEANAMKFTTDAKVQKKENSANWVDNVPTPIPGKTALTFNTLEGKMKFAELDNEYADQFEIGERYKLTVSLKSKTDKYGNAQFVVHEIIDAMKE